MRHRRSAAGMATLAVILATLLLCAPTAGAGTGDTYSEAVNGSGDFAWWNHYMNDNWTIQLHAHDPDGIKSLWWNWDGPLWHEIPVNAPGGAHDFYEAFVAVVDHTVHWDDGRHTLYLYAQGYFSVGWPVSTYYLDAAEAAHGYSVSIDSTPPVNSETHVTPDGSGDLDRWYRAPIAFLFKATDPAPADGFHSGLSAIRCYVDGSTVPAAGLSYGSPPVGPDSGQMSYSLPAPANGSNDGAHQIKYISRDWSYPSASAPFVNSYATGSIDCTPPTMSQTGADAAWHKDPVPLVFSAADPSSGVRLIEVAVDGAAPLGQTFQADTGLWGPASATFAYTFPAPADHSGDGLHTLAYRAYDWSYPHDATAKYVEQTCQVKIDTLPPVTTQAGGDSGPHNTPVTVAFSASDPNPPNCSGVDHTSYQVDGGGWQQGSSVTIPAPPHTTATHVVEYRSVDKAGNSEAIRSCRVEIATDSAAPVTTVSGADAAWHRSPVTLTFTATDPPPDPSGVKYTEWQLDGGAWTQGLTCAVPAPADHSADGLHTVAYRSVDNGDNTEATRTCVVKIDTTGPTTTALAGVSVKQGKTARFRFTFTDLGPGGVALSPTATVRIVITKGSATKKTLRLGTRNAGAQLTYRWKCTLKKGTYSWSVLATDQAGNAQAAAGSRNLKVK